MKRFAALILAAGIALSSAQTSFAASSYVVTVGEKQVSFSRDGRVTGTYTMSNNNLYLNTDREGDLMICFYDGKGTFSGVTLGDQQSVTIQGSMDTLTLQSGLDRSVVVGSNARVFEMVVDAPVNVSLYGRVGELSIQDSANVTANKGSVIQSVSMDDEDANFYENEGATINNDSDYDGDRYTGDSTVSNGITLRTNTIYAYDGATLEDLEYDLEDSVSAYKGNERIDGVAEWISNTNTEVTHSRSYSYRFLPDTGNKTATGTIKVVLEDDGDPLELEIDPISASSYTKRLSSYKSKLNRNVTAYNERGYEVSGSCRWVRSNDKVDGSGWYEFIFIPDNTKYGVVRDEMEIIIDGDDDDSFYDGDIKLRFSTIEVSSGSKRLRNLTSQLKNAVKAYDEKNRRITGTVEWVDDPDTRVSGSDYYESRFIPNSSKYDSVTDSIMIRVR